MKGVVISVALLIIGFSLSNVPLAAEQRVATTDIAVESTRRIPFEAIKVYPDEVRIEYPGLRYARVTSDSMAPLITHDSIVFEKIPTSADEIHVGDIISFYEPSIDKVVLHMVIGIAEQDGQQYFQTKGVANSDEDAWLVPFEHVKGIFVGTVR